jgi:putative endonuclease
VTSHTREAWFVYLARCSDGSLYCGVAKDVAARLAQHDAGKGARYTRGRGPLALVAKRRCSSHGEALRLELAVKALSREEKERLANGRRFRAMAQSTSGSSAARTAPGKGVGRRPSRSTKT